MKRRFGIFCILIAVLSVTSRAVFADPPVPFHINLVVTPPHAHVGDRVTAICVVVPLGKKYPLVQSTLSYPAKHLSEPRFIHRAFEKMLRWFGRLALLLRGREK